MIALPPNPALNRPIIDWSIEVQKTLRRLRPTSGPGIRITESENGLVISAAQSPTVAGTAAAPELQPWQITDIAGVGDPDPSTHLYASYTCKIVPGTIMGIMPGNMLDTFTVSADLNKFIARATTDGKVMTSVSIVASTSDPVPQDAGLNQLPETFDLLFGIMFAGNPSRTIGTGNPRIIPLQILTTPMATPPAPGMPAEDRWYIWSF